MLALTVYALIGRRSMHEKKEAVHTEHLELLMSECTSREHEVWHTANTI